MNHCTVGANCPWHARHWIIAHTTSSNAINDRLSKSQHWFLGLAPMLMDLLHNRKRDVVKLIDHGGMYRISAHWVTKIRFL